MYTILKSVSNAQLSTLAARERVDAYQQVTQGR